MTFAVIGSGPCGSLAALKLLQAGQTVVMFEVDSHELIESTGLSKRLKLVDGSSATYDIHQLLSVVHKNMDLGFYRAKLAGGFSNVWGATWGAQESLKSGDWNQNLQFVTNLLVQDGYLEGKANQVCECLSFIEGLESNLPPGVSIRRTLLALNPDICDCIPNGYSSCIHGAVWNSKSLLNQCLSFNTFSMNTGRDVIGFEKRDGRIIVNGDGFSEIFENVIVAAGSVGTIEVLLNSNVGSKELILQDTLMGFLPLFRFKIRKKHQGGFAFSQYSFEMKFGKNNLKAHVQLYADAEIYRDRILGKLPTVLSPLVVPFIELLLPHLAIAIIYRDQAGSPRIAFSKTAEKRQLTVDFLEPPHSAKGLTWQLWKIFKSIGFLPLLPLLSWSKPGESYHLGAVENQILSEFGSVKSMPGLHVGGAFALPSLEPGPITHSSMAQTSRLIEHILTKI